MLDKISSYHLIYELQMGGKAGVYPELEPLDIDSIIQELSRRSGWSPSTDVLQWIEWFLTEDGDATVNQKLEVSSLKRIITAERRALKKLGNGPEE